MTAAEETRLQAGRRPGRARARVLIAALVAGLILTSALSEFLYSLPGLEWIPQVQLHMQFNSYAFLLIFLPGVLILYALYRESPVANWIIASASLVLYATVGLVYLLPLLFTCAFDYIAGAYMARSSDERRRKMVFVASVTVQLFLLCAFKYTGWLSGELNKLAAFLGLGIAVTQVSLPLPPGISFYTFHTISYTADVYRRRFTPQGSFIDYVTFVAFFPQLIAGPIARASELLPQVAARRPPVGAAQAEEAFWLIVWGLFKKMCLADNFGSLVDQAGATLPEGGVGYIFMYAFAAQIYCDFSAYTDIARGIAKLFGIELTRNFLTPYFSLSPSEFWQRWHISLSRWLRDYLYIPLGGDRHGRWKTLRNLGVTMFLGGLWHGAGVGFIAWGLYHGVLLVLYRLLPIDQILQRRFKRVGTALAMALMFNLVCIGWILFRAKGTDIVPLLSSLAVLPSIDPGTATGKLCALLAILGLPLIATELFAYRRAVEFVDLYGRMPWWMRSALYVAIFYLILFFAAREQNEFIYFQF